MNNPIHLVAGREISERTRSRAFLISTLTIVAVVLAAIIVPGLKDSTTRRHVGLTGATPAALSVALHDAARTMDVRLQIRRYPTLTAGEAAVRDGGANVLIVAGRRLVWKSQPDARTATIVRSAAQRLRFGERARELGLEPAQTLSLLAPAAVPERRLQAADPDQDARETIAMVTYLLLLMMVLWYGSAVADGIAQEKGGRIMELLVSRIRGRDLLAGKVLGIGAVGLAQMLLALLTAAVATLALDTIDVPDAVPATLASAVLWFVLGYLFWSVAYASVAALVSRRGSAGRRRAGGLGARALGADGARRGRGPGRVVHGRRVAVPDDRAIRDARPDRRQRRRAVGDDRRRNHHARGDLRPRPPRRGRLLGGAAAQGRQAGAARRLVRRPEQVNRAFAIVFAILLGGRVMIAHTRSERTGCD